MTASTPPANKPFLRAAASDISLFVIIFCVVEFISSKLRKLQHFHNIIAPNNKKTA